MTPAEIRDQAAKSFRRLTKASGINLAQFAAQIEEENSVRALVGLRDDITVPPALRRQCAIDIITVARGPIAPWVHDGRTISATDIGNTGASVAQEIDQARSLSSLYQQLDELVRNNVPSSQWPDSVRQLAGDMINIIDADTDTV